MNNHYYKELLAKVKLGNDVFIAHNAVVIGDIVLGNNVSVWYGAVLRADLDKIIVGDRTNIQEGCIFHVDPGKPINVGKGNIIGHGAILHGCTIGDSNLIGMRATVMNGAKIGNGCIIGAHALITENMVVPDFSMVLGAPGKITKQLPPEVVNLIKLGEDEYVHEAMKYLSASS
jgi:carbonic anhydrase/acetyltransferase-like protein (isoleucine patch superfamily)